MTTTAAPRASRRRTVRRYVPPQHGAWAMLIVPWLVGVLVAGFEWLHLPLLLAWLAGYLLSYYVMQAVKSRRPQRYRSQLLLYGVATLVAAVPVLALRPQLFWYAPAYALLLAVNLHYAWRRRERALVNDIASIVQGSLMVPVAATVAGVAVAEVALPFAAVALYFFGTVFYVKTMIRERGSAAYYRASVAYHVLALVAVAWLLGPLPAGLFALLLVRAALLPRRSLTPKQVGILEIIASLLLVLAVLLG